MIRSGKLGCTPGGNCCSSCRDHHLGQTDEAGGDTTNALWLTAFMVVGGFFLAAAAGGKLGKR